MTNNKLTIAVVFQTLVLIVAVAVAWGRMETRVEVVEESISGLADSCATREVQEVQASWLQSWRSELQAQIERLIRRVERVEGHR